MPELSTYSRHKRSISIDFKHPQGYELIERLICTADVLIDTFRPGVMEKLKLGPERMCKENDKLIYARISGFGQSGKRVREEWNARVFLLLKVTFSQKWMLEPLVHASYRKIF